MAVKGRPLTQAERSALSRKRKAKRELEVRMGHPDGVPDGVAGIPFGPGHTLGVVHGAYSRNLVQRDADVLMEAFLARASTPDYLREESYRDKLGDYFFCRAQVLRLRSFVADKPLEEALEERQWIDEVTTEEGGAVRKRTEVRTVINAWKMLESAERRMDVSMSKLGLDPLSRFRMGKDVAAAKADLALIWAAEEAKERGAD